MTAIVLGSTKQGVIAYYNNDHNYSEKNYHNNIFTGFKYECVEFVRRWLLIIKK